MVSIGEGAGSQGKPTYNFFTAPQPLDISAFAKPDDIEDVVRFLRHDGSFDGQVVHAIGRNVTLPLVEPPHPLYDSIQISGGAYIPMGVTTNSQARGSVITWDPTMPKEIHPPAEGSQRYTHTYSVLRDGALESHHDSSPLGSYTESLADQKIARTARAGKIDSERLVVPKVLGKYRFTNLSDGEGGNATALLFAVPLQGLRADQAYVAPLLDILQQRPDLLDAALDSYMPPIMKTLGMIGIAAADIHGAGVVHSQLTLGNVLPMQTRQPGSTDLIYVADWETATEIETKDENLLRVLDLVTAFRSFSGGVERILSEHNTGKDRITPILFEGFIVLISNYVGLSSEQITRSLRHHKRLWQDSLAAAMNLSDDVRTLSPLVDLMEQLKRSKEA
jgi:hypothetical protein